MASYSYISDITKTSARTTRIAFVDLGFSLGSPLGLLLGDLLYYRVGYEGVYGVSAGLFLVAISYTLVRIRDRKGSGMGQDSVEVNRGSDGGSRVTENSADRERRNVGLGGREIGNGVTYGSFGTTGNSEMGNSLSNGAPRASDGDFSATGNSEMGNSLNNGVRGVNNGGLGVTGNRLSNGGGVGDGCLGNGVGTRQMCLDLCDMENVRLSFAAAFKRRPNRGRAKILALIAALCLMVAQFGEWC